MALFHLSVTQTKRSAGQSAIASAAYRAGERLYSEYYGEYSDYTRKGGVICSDILLPSHAPKEYADRQTLWNAVEKAERGKTAQLAYSFEISLQNEFSLEENIALARKFLLEQFVSRGMTVDVSFHEKEHEDGGTPNPHFHFLCPIRPIEQDGTWGLKQRRVYALDEDGNRIRDQNGEFVFNAVPTTDWGSPETLEHWRQTWAEMCNAKFAEKGLTVRIDHRSYERQGVDLLPTIHEGATVRAMEKKGIRTEKGEFNRWIKATNAVIRDIKKKITLLFDWIAEAKAELAKPQTPDLVSLLNAYYTQRKAGAYSQKGKISNLKEMNETFNYLRANGIYTLEDLESHVNEHSSTTESLKKTLDGQTARMKEIKRLYDYSATFQSLKPVCDGLQKIKFEKSRAKYKAEHADELKMFYTARRKLTGAQHRPAGECPYPQRPERGLRRQRRLLRHPVAGPDHHRQRGLRGRDRAHCDPQGLGHRSHRHGQRQRGPELRRRLPDPDAGRPGAGLPVGCLQVRPHRQAARGRRQAPPAHRHRRRPEWQHRPGLP